MQERVERAANAVLKANASVGPLELLGLLDREEHQADRKAQNAVGRVFRCPEPPQLPFSARKQGGMGQLRYRI